MMVVVHDMPKQGALYGWSAYRAIRVAVRG